MELNYLGYPFTWSNGRQGESSIQCRLDRVCGNEEFSARFSPIQVTHLPRFGLDHAVIMMQLEKSTSEDCRRKPRIFRFEGVWAKDERCHDVIRRKWGLGQQFCTQKMEAMKGLDIEFDEYRLSNIRKEIGRIENFLKDSNMWEDSAEDLAKYKDLDKKLKELLKNEETMWHQRSRVMWLKDGDKNTKFFHNKAIQRKKVNGIKKIRDEEGTWWRGGYHVERVLVFYFSSLFTSSNPTDIEETCQVVRCKLNDEMKSWCSVAFTSEEVHEVVFQMHPLKSPGPDGLPALFFQKYWGIVGRDVSDLALNILNSDSSPEEINNTFIVLIPKCKNPSSPTHFRPISLCKQCCHEVCHED